MIHITDAIKSLRSNTEWTLNGDNVEKIIWHTENVKPLTGEEVAAEMARLEQAELDKVAANSAAREAAISHAKSLGFTNDMIAVMYPNLIG